MRGRERDVEFRIIGSNSFHICAPFTAMEFLKTLVRALATYKSPLSFDRVVLIEMFEIVMNNAHILQSGAGAPFV